MRVGTKELKNRLSYYLRRVRAGESVYVADRDQVIAELRPIGTPRNTEEESLRKLAEQGLMTLGRGKFRDFKPARIRKGVPASRVVIEDRD